MPSSRKCVLCNAGTAGEPIVHETCHDQEVKDQTRACSECERTFSEINAAADYDAVVHELRLRWLPHYRQAVA